MRSRLLRHLVPAAVATGALLVPTAWAVSPAGAAPDRSSTGSIAGARSPKRTEGSRSSTASSTGSKSSRASTGAAAGRRTHIVRPGDTVAGIARRYGVSADSVRAANGIVDDELYRGARLIIDGSIGGGSSDGSSASRADARSSSSSSGGRYTVEEGDTLSGIAEDHGVSLSALLKANHMTSRSLILPGHTVVIPGSTRSRAPSRRPSGSRSAGSVGPDLRCPVPGSSFMNDWGFPRDDGGRFHEGTDIFAPRGTTVRAPASGTVVFGRNHLGGTTFTLTTATGWEIYGAHMSATIGSSRSVRAGEAIGWVGNTGNAAGGDTHLHMGLKRVGGRAMNPYPSVRAACG